MAAEQADRITDDVWIPVGRTIAWQLRFSGAAKSGRSTADGGDVDLCHLDMAFDIDASVAAGRHQERSRE